MEKLFVDIRLLRICYLNIYNHKNYGQFDRSDEIDAATVEI